MRTATKNGISVAIIDRTHKIGSIQDILDLMAEVYFQGQYIGMIIDRESLDDRFFDLKTGFAGEVLQKFANYNFKLGIVGDFSVYQSQSLKDFIYECNRGRLIFFKDDTESALAAMIP